MSSGNWRFQKILFNNAGFLSDSSNLIIIAFFLFLSICSDIIGGIEIKIRGRDNLKKIILGFIFIAAISLVFCNFALAEAEPGPIRPELKLTVEQSPLAIYPPIMIYTAQLSYIPPIYTGQLIADFYNIPDNSSSARIEYLGSAPFDKTGKAVFIKQMNPGLYTGIAKTTINGIVIWSNKVEYRVR